MLHALLWQQPLLGRCCIQLHHRQQTWQQGCHGVKSPASSDSPDMSCFQGYDIETLETRQDRTEALRHWVHVEFASRPMPSTSLEADTYHVYTCKSLWKNPTILPHQTPAWIRIAPNVKCKIKPCIMEDAARCKSLMMTLRLACITSSAARDRS